MAIKHHSNENFLDNNKLTFGTSDDLQLYHSGSHSYVDGNNTGDLYIRSLNDDVVVQAADDVFIYTQGGEDAIIARGDGGVELYHNNVKKFETTSAGATFAGDIHLGANYIGRDTHNIIDFATDNHITFKTDQSTALQIDSNQSVKVVAGSLQISGDNANYVTLTESGSGDFTIDAADDIRLDAGGGDVVLKDDGTEFGRLTNSSTDFVISASTQDKDILFKGDDGGSAITALTLDMSDGGWATFNSGIAVANTFSPSTFGKATFAGVVDFNGSETRFNPNANSSAKIYSVGTNATALYAGAGDGLYLGANDAAGMYFASGVDATFLGNVTLADAKNLNLGADSDLQLYHDATHSHIVNLTGNLRIRNFADDSDVTLESDDGSGGTTAYLTLDGSAGLTLSNVNMKWNDGVSAVFGTGGDSLVRHTGTNMEITNSAGVVLVTGTPVNFGVDDTGIDVKFFGATSGRYMLWDESGDYLKFTDGAQAVFGTGGDLGIQHDGGNSYIVHGGTGNLIIRQNTNDADIKFDCDDGAGGTATYLTLDGSDTSVLFSKTLKVVDSAYIGLGDSFDFHLQHNGTDSKITNSTGDLYITNGADDKRIRFQADDGAGGVTTYFDMQGSAATHDGSATTSLFTQWYDNSRISFGNGHDTQIYHDGTNTNFYHQTGNLIFKQAEADGDMIFQADDGSGGLATYLTLDGSATTVNVTKKLIVDTGSDNLIAEFKSSGDSIGEIRIADNSKYTRLLTVGDTFKIMPSDGDEVFNVSDSAISVLAPLTVGVDDTGHDVKFFGATSGRSMLWDESYDGLILSDNTKLQLGSSTGYGDLQLLHDGTNSYVKNHFGNLYITNHADDKDIIFQSDDGSGGVETYFFLDGSANGSDPLTIFPDNSYLAIGSGTDLYFNHNGTNSFIQNATGNLIINQRTNDGDLILQCDDGSGGETAYLTLDGTNVRTKFHKNVNLEDDVQLQIGNSQDLKLYHSGSHSYISQEGVGNLYIQTLTDDGDIIFMSDDGSGGIEEYFRLDGSANGATPLTVFPDSSQLAFGSGPDTYVYHNGSDFYLDNYTGDFYITAQADDKDIIFRCDNGSGGTTTYFKLDGSSASDGTLYTQFPDNSNLTFGSADDLQIKHDGTDSKITNSTGDLVIRNLADNKDVIFQSDDGSGGVETYFFLNGGLSSPYTIFPDGTHIGLGNSIDLAIYHDSANSYLSQNGTGNLIIQHAVADSDIIFRADDGSGGTTAYLTLDGSAETINAAKSMVFADNAAAYFGAGLDLEINSNGSSSSITGRVGDLTIGCSTDDGDIIFSSDDGSGGTTEYIRIDGGQTRTEFAKPTQHADNAIANFGSSSDMQIYHNGTDSYILNGTGDLEIINNTDDGDIIFKSDDGSGGTTEYFRLDGGDVKIDFTQNVRHGDNVMTNWGSSNDLQIYHDGTDSYVSNTQNSGDLIIENGGNNKDVIFRCDDNSGGLTAYLTLDGSATNVNIHKQAVFSDELVIPEYIVHTGDGNTGFGFAADDTFRVITGGTTRLNITTGIELTGNATFTGDVNLADSKKLQLGASQDLQIFHDGTNTFIESYTGNFDISQLLDDGTMRFRADDGSGGTTTYLDLNGNDGTINAHVEIRWPDGIKAKFGSSQDLQIYHDGSNSYIDDGGTGELRIRASATAITSANGNEYIAYFAGTGGQSASLYAGGSKKLETTSTGISVTGDVTVSDDIFVADSGIINLGSGNDLKILHDSNHSYIKNYTGDLYIENFADDKDIIFKSDDGSGGVTAYLTLDGSIAKTTVSRPLKFNDNISAEYGTDTDMIMYSSGSHGYIENYTGDLKFINNTNDKDIIFQSDDQSGGAATYFYLDGSVGFNRFPYPVIVEDSVNFNLGTGQDMQLLHNGSDSVIRNSTGDLYITNYADDKDIIFQSDNGSGGDATYFRLDGSEVETRFHKATLHYDNVKAKYGDSGDLQIYHDGSHSFIADSGTGHLQILSSQLQINNAGNTENMITAAENGSVTLFNDGSAKLATTSTGVAVTGDVTVSDDIFVADSGIINLGTGNDLQIYHSGSNSHITDAGTGNLFIEGSNHIYFRSADQGEYYAQFNDDGACKFYHNNVVKLETTSAGITVAGNIVLSDDGTIGSASDTDAISIDDSGVVTFSSRIIANVREFEVASGTDGDGKGDVVYFGSTTSMTAGKIYHYKSDGTWELADASAVATCDGLLAVALGTASNTHGMLLRGMVTIANDPGAVGDVLYVSETGGQAIATAPSTSNAIVRVIGYCVHATNGNIWFNPDGTFVEVA